MDNVDYVLNKFYKNKIFSQMYQNILNMDKDDQDYIISKVLDQLQIYNPTYNRYSLIVDFLNRHTVYLNDCNISNDVRWKYLKNKKTNKVLCKMCGSLLLNFKYGDFCSNSCSKYYQIKNNELDYIKKCWCLKRGGYILNSMYKRNKNFKQYVDVEVNKILQQIPTNFTVAQKCYHILNEDHNIPKCPVCGKYCNFHINKYSRTCSKKCSNINVDYISKRLKHNTYQLGQFTNVGHNEQYILDCLELKFGINIKRQQHIEHYCVDGLYNNTIIEINEPHHLYNKQFNKDIRKYNFLLKRGYQILICWDNIKYYTTYQKNKLSQLSSNFPQIRQTFFKGSRQSIKILSTDNTFSEFDGVKKSNIPQPVVSISLSGDKKITGTLDHEIMCGDRNIKLSDIRKGDYIDGYCVENIKHGEEFVYDPVNVVHKHLYKSDGFTMHNCLVIDEAAFIPPGLAEEFYTSVYPTVSSSKETQIVMVSTPNGQGNQFYDTWNKAILKIDDDGAGGKVKWTPCRIDWWDVPGRDEQWKQIQLESYNGDMVKFNQEFGNCVDEDTEIELYDTKTNRYFTTTIGQFYQMLKCDGLIERSVNS